MTGCVLRVSGTYAALVSASTDAFVQLVEARASARARKSKKVDATARSTFNYTVSDASGTRVPVQIHDAEEFLSAHLAELTELRSRPGIESVLLDFGWEIPCDANGQFNRFPSALLALCVQARLDIMVSVYLFEPGSDDR
jgi:hypothetical protein